MKRKVISIALVTLLILSVLAGCQQNATESSATSAPSQTTTKGGTTTATTSATDSGIVTEPGAFPIVNEDYKISLMFPSNATVTDYVDNDYTRYVQERTGVELEMIVLTGDNPVQQVELMVSSGEELADIISLNLTAVSRASMYEQGVILPLDDLFEQYSHYWHIMADKYCTERELTYMNGLTRTYDGSLICFPLYYADPSNEFNPGATIYLRNAWAESMGLETPKTTDALYEVLKRIRDEDPNANGQKDEIPLLGSGALNVIMNSFVYYNGLLNATDGKLWSPVTTDEYREGLRYLNKLVEEGLYSPTSFTIDATQFNSIMNIEDSGQAPTVGMFSSHPTTTFDDASGRRLEYSPVFPIAGPAGVAYAMCSPNAQDYFTSVTKYCDNPEVAVRLLDSFCEREFMLTSRWGLKDRDWIDLGEDNTGYEACRYGCLGYETQFIYVVNPYGSSNNIIWKWDRLTSLPPRLMGAQAVITEQNRNRTLPDGSAVELATTTQYSLNAAQLVCTKSTSIPDEIVGKILYTAEEDLAINDIRTSLDTYVNECKTRFVTGELSVEDDWDEYISTLKSIGLDEYVATSQTAYTRTGSNAAGAGIVR